MKFLKQERVFTLSECVTEKVLDILPIFSCAISLILKSPLSNLDIALIKCLNKQDKKIAAVIKVREAFLKFKKIKEYKICKLLSLAVIRLDDLLDHGKTKQFDDYLTEVKSQLEILLDCEKIQDEQKTYIDTLFKLTIADVEFDANLNQSEDLQIESLDNLRENGYPSTLVGMAICLGLMGDEGNYKYVENIEFKALIDNISYLARICDDVVSDVDARNLVWDGASDEFNNAAELNSLQEGEFSTFKKDVNLDSLSDKINELKTKIENSISQLGFNKVQKQFVESVAFYYLEYLKKWLTRQNLEILRNFINLINN